MTEWKETTLGEISTNISYGYTESANNKPVGPRFLRITDIASERLQWDKVPYCPITKKNLEKYLLQSGDIVIARTGATTGTTYTIKTKDPKNVVFASYLIRYQIDKSLADPFFVDFVLRSNYWACFVDGIKGGSAQPGANAKQFASFEFLLPPLPEQKAIAEVLSSLDDKIGLLHRQNKILEEMAETLYDSWVSENEFESTIKDLIDIQNGYAFKSRSFQDNGSHRVLKIKNISGGIVEIQTTDFVSASIISSIDKRFAINTGDILFAMTGAKIGKMGIIPQTEKSLWLNQRVGLFKEKYKGARFLAYLHLKSNFGVDYIENTATGSAQPNISGIGIENCEFPNFSEQLLLEYSEQFDLLFSKVIFNLGQIRTLEKMRDTLLPKLMSGEVRVNFEELKEKIV